MKTLGYFESQPKSKPERGISLAAQESKLRSYADLYELDLVAVISDAGQSAKTLIRPGGTDPRFFST